MKWQPSGPALLGGVVCALLTGCSVGPTYKRPDIAVPTQWHETGADGASASVWPAADWWHGFGSAKLDELIAAAERNNDDLAGAIARVQEADAQARIAGAALLPSLDLGASATRERAKSTSGAGGAQVFNVFNNTTFSLPGVSLSSPSTFGYYSGTDTNSRRIALTGRLTW